MSNTQNNNAWGFDEAEEVQTEEVMSPEDQALYDAMLQEEAEAAGQTVTTEADPLSAGLEAAHALQEEAKAREAAKAKAEQEAAEAKAQEEAEANFIPLLRKECLKCTHLVGALANGTGKCIDDPACPAARGLTLGLGVDFSLVPMYTKALLSGDTETCTSLNNKLDKSHPISRAGFMRRVAQDVAASATNNVEQ